MSFISTFPTNIPKYGYVVVAVKETIVDKSYPLVYIPKPLGSKELISKVEGATIIQVSSDFPKHLEKQGKAKDLISKF